MAGVSMICTFPVRNFYLPFRKIETFRYLSKMRNTKHINTSGRFRPCQFFLNQGYLILFPGTSTVCLQKTESRSGIEKTWDENCKVRNVLISRS